MAELLSSLHDRSLLLSDRVKVASYLWRQNELLAAEENGFLLNWSCQELCLAYSKKNKSPPPHVTTGNLWALLGVIVKAVVEDGLVMALPALNSYLFQGMGVVFSSTAVSISDDDDDLIFCSVEASKCLRSIFMFPNFPSALSIFETMVSLLESVLKLGVACLCHTHQQLQLSVFPALKCLLEYYVYLEATQGNRKKVFSATCNQLLCSALQLHSLLQSTPTVDEGCDIGTLIAIRNALEAVFRLLFKSDVLSEYSSALSCCCSVAVSAERDRGVGEKVRPRTAVSSTRLLFDVLEQFLHSEGNQKAVEALPIFFNSFLSENSISHKVPKSIEFNFFVRVLWLLGIMDECAIANEKASCTPAREDLQQVLAAYFGKKKGKKGRKAALSLKPKLMAYQRCLELVLDYQVYQVAEDMNSDQKQTIHFKFLVNQAMRQLHPDNLTLYFGILCAMVKLNHLLLEPWLPVVWSLVPSLDKARHQPSAEHLINTCVDIYAKLRQLPLLFEKQLDVTDVISGPSFSTERLPPLALVSSFERLLSNHISCLPPGQATTILESHVNYFQRHLKDLSVQTAPVCIQASVARSVGLFCVLLPHLPLSLWCGKWRNTAIQLTLSLVEDVCHNMLMAARAELEPILPQHPPCPLSTTAPLSTTVPGPLVTAALLLTSECCEVLTRLHLHLSPSSLLPRWPLHLSIKGHSHSHSHSTEGHCPPQHCLVQQWEGMVPPQQPTTRFLLKRLAIQQLKFSSLSTMKELDDQELLDFIFLPEVLPEACEGEWFGQVFSVSAGNYYGVAYWSLVLSHLPFLYASCSEQHLETVSDFILSAVVPPSSEEVGEDPCSRGVSEEVELASVVTEFLQSEAFLEMRRLHETLFSQYLSAIKSKSLPKSLRHTLKLCGSTEAGIVIGGFPTAFRTTLQYGLEAVTGGGAGGDSPSPCNYTCNKLLSNCRLVVYLKLVKFLPGCSLRLSLMLKCVLVGLVYHVLLVHLLVQEGMDFPSQEDADKANTREDMWYCLSELTYVLIWQLHALLTSAGKRKTKKKRTLVGVEEMDQLLQWWYGLVLHLYSSRSHARVFVSGMVAMEMTLALRLSCHGYPQHFTSMVASNLTDASKPADLVGRVLLTITETMSKEFLMKTGKFKDHTPLCHMCGLVLEAVEQLVSKGPLALLSSHPHIFSLLAILTNLDPTLECGAMICKVANWLWSAEVKDEVTLLVEDGAPFSNLMQFEELSGYLDCFALRLRTLVAPSTTGSAPPPTLQVKGETGELEEHGMELDHGTATDAGDGMSVVLLWNQVKQILSDVLHHLGEGHSMSFALPVLRTIAGREWGGAGGGAGGGCRMQTVSVTDIEEADEEGKRKELIFEMILDKIRGVLQQILNVTNQDAVHGILQQLDKECLVAGSSACTYCVCWLVILDSKLPQQQVRAAIRHRLHKVLLSCLSIAELQCTHSSTHYLVVLAIQLAAHVLSMPSRVGIDKGDHVLTTLQLCSFSSLENPDPIMVLRTVEASVQLMTSVIRQHSAVVNHTPAPFIMATNSVISVVVEFGQKEAAFTSGPTSPYLTFTLRCASLLARVMEMLSHQKCLYRFFPSVLFKFLDCFQRRFLHAEVKSCLVPGVFSLLKLCPPSELAFLKSSLDSQGRDAFQVFMQEFKSNFKFGGRV